MRASYLWGGAALAVAALLLSRRAEASVSGNVPADQVRGIRNNNPGNLRAGIAWQGASGQDATGYLIFAPHPTKGRAFWGIRAMVRDILDDHVRDGKRTLRQLITEYAPHSENPTEAYIAATTRALGVRDNDPLDLYRNRAQLTALVRAMIYQENGVQPYSDAELSAGIAEGVASFHP